MSEQTVNYVNVANTSIINGTVVAVFPPNSPWAKLSSQSGVQTTPQLARGYMPGSSVNALNGDLSHVCDFKFIFNLNLGLGGLTLPTAALQNAIKNAKLAAAAKMTQLTQLAVKEFRDVINAILEVLSFDPSGQLSLSFTIGKDLLRKVNNLIEWAAQQVQDVLTWVFFAQQIAQLINWIKSLPEKIQQLLQNCLTNFNNSLNAIANSVKSLPAQLENQTVGQAQQLAQQVTTNVTQTINQLQTSLSSTTNSLPPSVINAISSPDSNSAQTFSDVFSSLPGANTLKSAVTQPPAMP